MKILQTLHDAMEKKGEPDGFIEQELAECLLATGKRDEARPHAAIAYRLLSKIQWVVESDSAGLKRMKDLCGSD